MDEVETELDCEVERIEVFLLDMEEVPKDFEGTLLEKDDTALDGNGLATKALDRDGLAGGATTAEVVPTTTPDGDGLAGGATNADDVPTTAPDRD